MMRFFCTLSSLFLFLSLLAAALPQSVQAAPPPPTFESTNCIHFNIRPEQVPALVTVICGYVTVPERHDTPQGKTIQIAVVVLSHASASAADPLFLAQGGPGGSTIDTYTTILFYKQPDLIRERQIILFDQRGTLYSKPNLVCNEMLDLSIELLDVDLPEEEVFQRSMNALQACRDRLNSQGIDLAAYNSYENAHDIDDIRRALGYDKINLYGVSYGTLLAQHTMRLHPEMLRSIILDSTVPTSVNFITEVPQTQDRSLRALFSACQTSPECNAEYPNLEQMLFGTVEQLNQNPIHVRLTDPETGQSYRALVNGDTLFYTLFMALYSSEFIPYLPRIIRDAEQGEYGVLAYLLSVLTFDRSMSYGMYYSVLCAEDADFTPQDTNIAGVYPYLAEDAEKDLEEMQTACQMWHSERFDAQADAPIVSDIPTLLISGNFDPITPPAFGQKAAEQLSQAYHFTLPLGSHGSFGSQPCANELMKVFLNNPYQAPNPACLSTTSTIPTFLTRSQFLPIPSIPQFLMLKDRLVIAGLIAYGAHILLLLSIALIWPLAAWLGKRRPHPAPAVQAANALAPWLPLASALWHLTMAGLLFFGMGSLALREDMLVFFGLPASFSLIPVAALTSTLLSITMLIITIFAWKNSIWSSARRIYYTLLTLNALAGIFLLLRWGILQSLWVG